MCKLHQDERLDHLLAEGLRIIQSPSVFSFSLDAVLLARFVQVPKQKGSIVDLCSGNGIIPLLLSKRTNASLTGVEIQERLYDMAKRSITYNDLSDRIQMVHSDLNALPNAIPTVPYNRYDVVTCNPPYFETPATSLKNENEHYAIARHEIMCTLDDVIRVSSKLLKHGGKAAFVHRPDRLMDILQTMRTYKIEPKRLRFVYPKIGKDANTILVEGIKGGKKDLKILSPLYVYDECGQYTEEVEEMLYGTKK